MDTIDDLIAERDRLNRRINVLNEQIATQRLHTPQVEGELIPHRDFVGKRVCVTDDFQVWLIERRYSGWLSSDSPITVVHVEPSDDERSLSVNLATEGRIIYGVPFALAQDMRKAYMREHGEG